jgi:exodeoxyribonuclease-5
MTNDQTSALQFLQSYVKRPRVRGEWAVVEGYAGVGKTWIAAEWLGTLVSTTRLKVLVCAPTNKALDVLRTKITEQCGQDIAAQMDFKTLHSYLGYRVKKNDDGDRETIKVGKVSEYDVVFCDEGSMVNAAFHRELLAQKVYLIYCGDPAQLQPVGEDTSPVFDTPHKVCMTEVVRQAQGNPIIELATYLRHRVQDNALFVLQDVRDFATDNRITFTAKRNVHDWAEHALDKALDACILAFDNATVNANNAAMHARRYPNDPLFGVGEVALVNEGHEVGDDLMLCNGQLLDVVQCVPADPIAGVDICDVTVNHPGPALVVDDVPVQRTITLQVAQNEAQCALVHGKLTTDLWAARKAGDIGKAHALAEQRRPLNNLAPLRHAYARTVHKSQGSTHDVAILDWGSIYRSREMRARLMYVGATRPSKFLVMATA